MTKPNILLISIEDLNDWIEPLGGHPDTITPNLTRLAQAGTNFDAAFANVPACSPSRTAALFGQAPWKTGMYNNGHVWDQFYPKNKRLSLVGCLRDAGYTTVGAGKIFYGAHKGVDRDDWDDYIENERIPYPPISPQVQQSKFGKGNDFGPDPENRLTWDERNTQSIIDRIKAGSSNMFWGLGLFRPHLPFIVPQQYFDRFPDVVAEPPGLCGKPFVAKDSWDLDDAPEEALEFARTARMGVVLERFGNYNAFLKSYLASITFADTLLGKVLDKLEAENLASNTYVVLWSDHGWQFGEKTAFKKFSLWERALRIPFMISGPGIEKQRVSSPVSLLDLFPTLMTLGGASAKHELDGHDLSGLLTGTDTLQRDYVCSAYTRDREGNDAAFSIRSSQYRYTRYWSGGEELYDHDRDPFEIDNLLHADCAQRSESMVRAEQLKKCIPDNPVAQIESRHKGSKKVRRKRPSKPASTSPLARFRRQLRKRIRTRAG